MDVTSDKLELLDLSFLRQRRTLARLAVATAVFALLGVLYSLVAPKWYRSLVTIVPAKTQRAPSLSSMLGGELGGVAAAFGDSVGVGGDVHRITAVLQSNDVSDAVVEKLDLKKRYRERSAEGAREALWSHCSVTTLPKPGLVQLSCEDKDPRFVQQLLQFFADYGNQVFRRVGVSSASEQVRFLERRVSELRAQADETAARMRAFQEKYQIVDIDTQTKAVVGAIASLNAQRTAKQLELEFARTFSSGDEATTRQLESQIRVMERKLRTLEDDPGSSSSNPDGKSAKQSDGLFPPALTVPKLRAEFETLYRDRKVSEATLVFALERLESAKADEARDTSTFLVLDPPAVPTRKARPRATPTLALFAVLGLAAALAFEWWRARGAALFGRSASPAPSRTSRPGGPETPSSAA